jgi:hypothetical protein
MTYNAQRNPRDAFAHRILLFRFLYIGALIAVLIVSFFVTLWWIDTSQPPRPRFEGPAAEELAKHRISSYSDLRQVAAELGLVLSNSMKANIDGIRRISDREVTTTGWLADPEGDETPLKLVIFVGGARVALTETKGERPDVRDALNLGFGSEKNVGFAVNFACQPGEQPVFVGLGPDGKYLPIPANRCS